MKAWIHRMGGTEMLIHVIMKLQDTKHKENILNAPKEKTRITSESGHREWDSALPWPQWEPEAVWQIQQVWLVTLHRQLRGKPWNRWLVQESACDKIIFKWETMYHNRKLSRVSCKGSVALQKGAETDRGTQLAGESSADSAALPAGRP